MKGTFHFEEGMLLRQRGGLILQRDAGARWRLITDLDAEELIGKRVKIEGILKSDDQIEVLRLASAQ